MFGLNALATKTLVIAVVALLAFGSGMRLEHQIATGRYAKLEKSYAEAQIRALEAARREQERLDNVATAAARREAAHQSRLADQARRALLEVKRHVKNVPVGCVTYGFIRVLDAAVFGVSADSLPLPTGKSDGSCAPVAPVDLARSIADNYATARANAEQLGALAAWAEAIKPGRSQ